MSVAEHLKIDAAEYDARIRTFIPDYDELIGTAAAALCVLGTGEDVYFALQDELEWLRGAGLMPEVIWRKGRFAVVAAVRAER